MTPGFASGHRRIRGIRGIRGFTLVELIATIVVLAVIGGATSSIILHNADGYLQASATSQLHHELSIGMDRIARELRRIDLDDSAAGIAPNIDAVSDTSLQWRDADDDAYELALAGDELRLGVKGGPARVLLDDVTGFSIQTFDENNAALPPTLSGIACDAIRRIGLSITLARHGVSETLTARVFMRSTSTGS